MVHLVLSSTKGNQGQRYFPYSGYLGLTPIRIDGIVRTKLDADQKGLPAKAITISVRCYESRIGRVNALHSNLLFDHTHTLWAKPDHLDYEPIANLEFPFRFNLPARIPGFSTAVFVDYRCLWRIEAVLHHVPITGVGSRQIRHFELPLVRYDLPPFPRSVSPPFPLLDQETNKRGAPRIRYSVNVPKVPIGPLDLISIPIHLQPIDHGVCIRSASVIVERRIILHDIPPAVAPPTTTTTAQASVTLQPPSDADAATPLNPSFNPAEQAYQELASEPASSSSTLSLGSSVPTITPNSIFPSTPSLATSTTPLIAPPPPPAAPPSAKVIVNPIAGAESSGSFSRDARGMWSKTLTLQWPAPKSHSRWAIGETISSELVSVKYFVRAKIIVTSASGTETVDLADEELLIVSTNEAERQLALAKYNETHDSADASSSSRSKSKSPRRSRPVDASGSHSAGAVPPSPALVQSSSSGSGGANLAPPSAAPSSYTRPKASSSRRPHTSAGPRDRPTNFAGGAYGRTRDESATGQGSSGSGSASGNGVGGASSSGTTSDGASGKRRSEMVGRVQVPVRPDTSHSTSTASSSLKSASLVSGRNSASFWSTVHSNGPSARRKEKEKEKEKDKDSRGSVRSGIGGGMGSASSTSGSVSSVSSRSRVVVVGGGTTTNGYGNAYGNGYGTGARKREAKAGDSSSSAAEMSDHMREWEAELARIEVKSRRSSDLVGFAGKKARVPPLPLGSVNGAGGGGGGALSKMPVPVPVPPVAVGARDV